MRRHITTTHAKMNFAPHRKTDTPVSSHDEIPQGAQLVTVDSARLHLKERFEICFSRTTADGLRRKGDLLEGVHYRKLRNSSVRYYLPALEKYFGV